MTVDGPIQRSLRIHDDAERPPELLTVVGTAGRLRRHPRRGQNRTHDGGSGHDR
jgi:hypothetical protein